MRINHKILSIPPYISTSWKNVTSLSLKQKGGEFILLITLLQGKEIEIPGLEPSLIETIFATHAKYLEQENTKPKSTSKSSSNEKILSFGFPLSGKGDLPLNLGDTMQHNPEQANMPNLPPEILDQITSISKALGIDDSALLPKPEPHCNCVYCQVAKALQSSHETKEIILDEPVSDEDLKFRDWDINPMSDKLYLVINPLDSKERYNVYLGEPVGCTCGENQCEHIRAVLQS